MAKQSYSFENVHLSSFECYFKINSTKLLLLFLYRISFVRFSMGTLDNTSDETEGKNVLSCIFPGTADMAQISFSDVDACPAPPYS